VEIVSEGDSETAGEHINGCEMVFSFISKCNRRNEKVEIIVIWEDLTKVFFILEVPRLTSTYELTTWLPPLHVVT
jgi:hypothetical protein